MATDADTTHAPGPVTLEEAIADLRSVSAIIDEIAEETRPKVEVKRQNHDRARYVVALALDAITSARATRLLIQHHLSSDAATTARRAFEFAVTAAWVQSERGSVEEAAKMGRYVAGKLANALIRTGAAIPAEALEEVTRNAPKKAELAAALRSFEETCNAFTPRLYIAYRQFSGYAHPFGSATAVHLYDEAPDELAQALWEALVTRLAAASAVWATRALDNLVVHKPRQDRLIEFGKRLGITRVLHKQMPDNPRGWPA